MEIFFRLPIGHSLNFPAIRKVDSDIIRSFFCNRFYWNLIAGYFLALFGELTEREAVFYASADIVNFTVKLVQILDLNVNQFKSIVNMQKVSRLLAGSAISDIRERFFKNVARQPQDNHPLVHFTHLPRSGNYPEAIYHSFYVVIFNIFL